MVSPLTLPPPAQPLAQGTHPSCLGLCLSRMQTKKASQIPLSGRLPCPLICPLLLPGGPGVLQGKHQLGTACKDKIWDGREPRAQGTLKGCRQSSPQFTSACLPGLLLCTFRQCSLQSSAPLGPCLGDFLSTEIIWPSTLPATIWGKDAHHMEQHLSEWNPRPPATTESPGAQRPSTSPAPLNL